MDFYEGEQQGGCGNMQYANEDEYDGEYNEGQKCGCGKKVFWINDEPNGMVWAHSRRR